MKLGNSILRWFDLFVRRNGEPCAVPACKKQLSRRIIDKVSDCVKLPENGVGLDIGCGSGALTIACARENPKASMVGLDRRGREYASFNKSLCQNNAKAEGVSERTSFVQGDACKLDFPDEHFDAVTSNYCYHNIPSRNRQEIILETLRVLKKAVSLPSMMSSPRVNTEICSIWCGG